MKLAVLSDIHGNWAALAAVAADVERWQPDAVLVNGDIVNGGPDSPRCWRYIQQRQSEDGWHVLRGNHEAYVVEWATGQPPQEGPAYDLIRLSHWTYNQLQGEVKALEALPASWRTALPGGMWALAMHASVLGDRAGIYPDASDEQVRSMIDGTADLFLTAHTHLPHIRTVSSTHVVNSGAVGLPGDGDRRASYAQLVWDDTGQLHSSIQRVAYDLAATERAFHESGLLATGGAEAQLTFLEWRLATDLRTKWSCRYREAILSGQLSHTDAVARFVQESGIADYLPACLPVH